jgi:hypothetical protein
VSHQSQGTAVEQALSQRARTALRRPQAAEVATPHAGDGPTDGPAAEPRSRPPAANLVEELRQRLLDGETHYPVRPGMVELRRRIDGRLTAHGLPARGPESVLITASEGESLFVTLLGLGIFPGGALLGAVGSRHGALLDWMGVGGNEGGLGPPSGTVARYRELDAGVPGRAGEDDSASLPRICAVGARLFLDEPLPLEAADIVVGTLDALVDMGPFSLGFVAAEPGVLKDITRWKQASSICSPAPSQRAALWALGVRE